MLAENLKKQANKSHFVSLESGFQTASIRFAIEQGYGIMNEMRTQEEEGLSSIESSSIASNNTDSEFAGVNHTQDPIPRKKKILARMCSQNKSALKVEKIPLQKPKQVLSSSPTHSQDQNLSHNVISYHPTDTAQPESKNQADTAHLELQRPEDTAHLKLQHPIDAHLESQRPADTANLDSQASQAEDRVNAEEAYCICRTESKGFMVAYEAIGCPIVWYHARCMKIKSVRKGPWICPDCKEKGRSV